jgi:hypothetical protein
VFDTVKIFYIYHVSPFDFHLSYVSVIACNMFSKLMQNPASKKTEPHAMPKGSISTIDKYIHGFLREFTISIGMPTNGTL